MHYFFVGFIHLNITFLFFKFQIINTYTEAVQTVDPQLATGKLHTLWVAFAKFYEDARQIEDVSISVIKFLYYGKSTYMHNKRIECVETD